MSKVRYISKIIDEMSFSGPMKMAFVTGPRQSGKTTLARALIEKRGAGAYHNWDQREFRATWTKSPQQLISALPAGQGVPPVLVLDEIHKSKLWKRTLKGIFDTLEERVDIVVTGSARLDTFKKGSDSLLGRYFSFRLHPFTLAEVMGAATLDPDTVLACLESGPSSATVEARDVLMQLLTLGGFPEPFWAQSERRSRAWRQLRLQQLIREDLRDLSRLPELGDVELLLALLPERAGSQLSRAALREDLEVAHTTVTRWLSYLEALYYHFELKPYAHSIKRSIKKEGKLFLWDYAEVEDAAHKFENLIAHHLLKACHFWTDAGYGAFELKYLRNADQGEIDFLITRDRKPWLPVEVKLREVTPSPHWKTFLPQLPISYGIQVVFEPENYLQKHHIEGKTVMVMDAQRFLMQLL